MGYALNFCELVGIFCIVGGMALFLGCLFAWIQDKINEAIFAYRYKHRFDKSPTAKCYCKDCQLHGDPNVPANRNLCRLPGSSRYTPDNGFCYEAEPRRMKR